MKEERDELSGKQLKERIRTSPDLRQSVILLFNYFDSVRVSLETDRIDPAVFGHSLGATVHDIVKRFEPWLDEQSAASKADFQKLLQLLPKE